VSSPDVDRALLRARELFLGDDTDETLDELETLLPALAGAGYVDVEEDRWGFTDAGRARADQLERDAG
jgi:hypothetical protein